MEMIDTREWVMKSMERNTASLGRQLSLDRQIRAREMENLRLMHALEDAKKELEKFNRMSDGEKKFKLSAFF